MDRVAPVTRCGMRQWMVLAAIGLVMLIGGGFLWAYFYLIQDINPTDEIEIKSPYTMSNAGISAWKIVYDKNKDAISESWNIEIPIIDFSKNYLLLSSGRRIEKLVYKRISQYKWSYNVPKGVAVYKDGFYPNSVFVYVIDKVPLKQDAD